MQDNTLVIVALVGLAVICLGLFVVLFVTVFRFTGRNFMSFLALLVRDSKESDRQPSYLRPPKPDLRAIAQAQDFDSALTRHIVQDEIAPQVAAQHDTPPNALPDSPFEQEPPRLGSRRRAQRPADRSRDHEDDMLGSLLDLGDDL